MFQTSGQNSRACSQADTLVTNDNQMFCRRLGLVGLGWVVEPAPVTLSDRGVWRMVVLHVATGVSPSGWLKQIAYVLPF